VPLTNTTGRLWVHTTSGGITGAGLRDGHFVVQATSGDLDLGFAAAPQQRTAKTESGNVEIAVPGDDPYRVGVETSAGASNITVRDRIPGPPAPSTCRPPAAT
jgi:Putative adhesin